MQGQVGLDDLIKKDREDRSKQRQQKPPRTKQIQKPRQRDNRDHHDGSRREQRTHASRPWKENFQDRLKDRPRGQRPQLSGYTVLVKGFVADVSSEDIYKILKGRKVMKISTFLENEGSEIVFKKDLAMNVKIRFADKEDANSFMEEYSNKLLDGKHNLSFTFVRS